jgi:hypothetical protein
LPEPKTLYLNQPEPLEALIYLVWFNGSSGSSKYSISQKKIICVGKTFFPVTKKWGETIATLEPPLIYKDFLAFLPEPF